jgi:hypothetical protein
MQKLNPYSVESADVVVGIPSYNEADNIAFVVEQANRGLSQYFPKYRAVVINADNDSPDNTREAFLNSMNTVPKIYLSTPPGVRGKGNNFYNLFTEVNRLGAKVVVVVDADLTSITPEWIRDLAYPILEKGFDFVTPLYSRNEYDGTITNNICYPLIYGLLGKDLRQPIGGDFAFSGRMASHFLEQPWHSTTRQYGIDIFMTLRALIGEFRVCQVALGAKIHKPSAPKLGPMFSQVVGTLFGTLLSCKDTWQDVSTVEEMPLFGHKELAQPQNLSVDYKGMKATARYEFEAHREILSQSLRPKVFARLAETYDSGKIHIGVDLWTRAVYDLLYAYDTSDSDPRVIEAMKSLYFGRVISFIRQTLDMDHQASEEEIQRQARHFFKLRRYFLRKYQGRKALAA